MSETSTLRNVATRHAFFHNARDAIRMPVLEKLWLVTSGVAERVINDDGEKQTVPVKRYELTKVGRQSYLKKDTTRGSVVSSGF